MATPEIKQTITFTAVIGSTPVVILLPRMRATPIAESGALAAADAWTTALTEHGAQPMRDTEFLGDPMPGWRVSVNRDLTAMRITGPDGLGAIYHGELEADMAWRQQAAPRHGLGEGWVIISGTADSTTLDAALEMMETERAVWVRARTFLTRVRRPSVR